MVPRVYILDQIYNNMTRAAAREDDETDLTRRSRTSIRLVAGRHWEREAGDSTTRQRQADRPSPPPPSNCGACIGTGPGCLFATDLGRKLVYSHPTHQHLSSRTEVDVGLDGNTTSTIDWTMSFRVTGGAMGVTATSAHCRHVCAPRHWMWCRGGCGCGLWSLGRILFWFLGRGFSSVVGWWCELYSAFYYAV